jgi:predicted nucleic acid-binding protein
MNVVSNSSPLIALGRIQRLDLLPALFGQIRIPLAVHTEVIQRAPQLSKPMWQASSWLVVTPTQDNHAVSILESSLDWGESEAIVLAQESQADLLIIDEAKGRAIAQRIGLPLMGTVGVLLAAKNDGIIPAVRPLLDDLLANEFRISQRLYHAILTQANE